VTKIINLYCEGMILHVHKDKTDELNLQSVATDFCFREYRQNIIRTYVCVGSDVGTSDQKCTHWRFGVFPQDIGVLGQSPYEIWKI
jgi:hypothetical protein